VNNYYFPDLSNISGNNFVKIFEHFNFIFKDKTKDRFLIATSGGPDSILLLYLVCKYFPDYKNKIIIGHINHNIRDDSGIDEEFVKIIGKVFKIKTYVRYLNPKNKLKNDNLEAWARSERYKCLNLILKETNSQWIITAHHANDQVETFLGNIAKKSGLFGLGGIKEINGNIIRPLLPFSKNDLSKIIKKNKIPSVFDKTNNNNNFNRNFIRNKVIKPWERRDRYLISGINYSINFIKEWQETMMFFINEFLNHHSKKTKNNTTLINKNHFKNLPILAQLTSLQLITDSIGILRKNDFNDIKQFLQKNKVGSTYKTKSDFIILIDRDSIIIDKFITLKKSNLEIQIGKNIRFGDYNYFLSDNVDEVSFTSNPNQELIDFDKIKNKKLILRNWEFGDYFTPLGMSGTQKLSDLLINNKKNIFQKNTQTVLTANGQIIWVCGLRIDNSVSITRETKNYLEIKRACIQA